jgi:hypothetical protein
VKRCPFCAEEIKAAAIVCRFCGREVVQAAPPSASTMPSVPSPLGYQTGPPRTNGFAVAALVLGILWLYGVGSILALIFGYVAKSQIDASGGTQQGRGIAVAGIVLGWVGVGLVILAFLIPLAG